MSIYLNQHPGLADLTPWPWSIRQVPNKQVFYIRDLHGAEVARLDGPQARERAELLMECRACFELHRNKQAYQKQHGLTVKQLV